MKDKIIPVILSAVILATGIGLFAWGVHNENKKNEEPKEDTTTPIVTTVTEPVEVTEPTVTTVTEEVTTAPTTKPVLSEPIYIYQEEEINYVPYSSLEGTLKEIPLGQVVNEEFSTAMKSYQDVPLNMTTINAWFTYSFAGICGEPSFYKAAQENKLEYVAFRTILSGKIANGLLGIDSEIAFEDTQAAKVRVDNMVSMIEQELGIELGEITYDYARKNPDYVEELKDKYGDLTSLDIVKDGHGKMTAVSADKKVSVVVTRYAASQFAGDYALVLAVYINP